MFEITENAQIRIKELVKKRQLITPIRIIASRGGCCGSYFSIGFDESRTDDEVITYDGLTYVINKTLLEQEKPIRVDYIESPEGDGFRITVQNESFQHNLISLLVNKVSNLK